MIKRYFNDSSEVQSIVYEADATRYDILISIVNNPDSDYDTQFVLSLVNFGECYFDSGLDSFGDIILNNSKTLGGIDAQNIQNAIAERFPYSAKKVKFDHITRRLIRVENQAV